MSHRSDSIGSSRTIPMFGKMYTEYHALLYKALPFVMTFLLLKKKDSHL